MTVNVYSSALLPSKIESSVAIQSFQSQRELLLNLFRHCLPTLANALWSKCLIHSDVREKALNQLIGSSERCLALLDCLEAKLAVKPSVYTTVVLVLESEPFLGDLASRMVHTYGKCCIILWLVRELAHTLSTTPEIFDHYLILALMMCMIAITHPTKL